MKRILLALAITAILFVVGTVCNSSQYIGEWSRVSREVIGVFWGIAMFLLLIPTILKK